jgi:hypothetical protein
MTKTACVFVLLMAWSTSGSAQSWSSEQQELIAQYATGLSHDARLRGFVAEWGTDGTCVAGAQSGHVGGVASSSHRRRRSTR